MSSPKEKLPFSLVLLPAFAKGFSVFYFVLLPIFYVEKLITSQELGYIGAAFIAAAIVGAIAIIRWLHALHSKKLLQISGWLAALATLALLFAVGESWVLLLGLSYVAMGLASGTAVSAINALTATNTTSGKRYKSLATQSMMTDLVRLAFPTFAASALAIGRLYAAVGLILVANLSFLWLTYKLNGLRDNSDSSNVEPDQVHSWWHNRPFRLVLVLEFLDSFSSSQLFVFIPLLYLAKGYSLQSALILQSSVFLGYMIGRWLIAVLAKRYSGIAAISIAEAGMVATIALLLLANGLTYLYLLSFALGIFTRGTSPAIRALSLDSLENHQVKQGTAAHAVAGDSGSAIAQLIFGLLVGWLSIYAPFIAAICVGILILLLCVVKGRLIAPVLVGRAS